MDYFNYEPLYLQQFHENKVPKESCHRDGNEISFNNSTRYAKANNTDL